MKLNGSCEVRSQLSATEKYGTIKNCFFQALIIFLMFILFAFVFSALGNIVWKGLAGLAHSISSQEIQFAIRLSLFTSFTSTLICVIFAIPVAYGLERFHFPTWICQCDFGYPFIAAPLVCGVALLLLFGTTSFGQTLADHGLRFIFSVKGIILAQFFIITPYMVRVLKSTIADINPRLEFVARTLGCSQWQAFYKITLPLAKNGIIAGLVISWARAIGEFGCALMVAGATRMVTETLPVAVYLNMAIGDLQMAMASATCLIFISLFSLFVFEMVGGKQNPASRIS